MQGSNPGVLVDYSHNAWVKTINFTLDMYKEKQSTCRKVRLGQALVSLKGKVHLLISWYKIDEPWVGERNGEHEHDYR